MMNGVPGLAGGVMEPIAHHFLLSLGAHYDLDDP